MSDLDVFAFGDLPVRILTIDGNPWFVAADICAILALDNVAMAVRPLDDDEKGVSTAETPGGPQQVGIISESGLYSLVLRSRKPEAKAFKRWVTHDVLPAIRRTGTYSIPAPRVDVDAITRADLARMILDSEAAREQAEQRVAELEPLAAVTTNLLTTSGDYSVREAAQILSRDHGIATGQRRLFGTLREIGWVDSKGIPYQQHINSGRLAVRVQTYDHPHTGEPTLARPQVRITPRGLAVLHDRLTPSTVLAAADAGHAAVQVLARILFLVVVALVAVATAWHAPAGTPLAALVAAGAGYVLVRLAGAGALAQPRHARQDRALARECVARDARAGAR